jgi:hypothetical protein
MPCEVCLGAVIQCSFGAAPSSLVVLPTALVNAGALPAAKITDFAPIVNIPTFGMCTAPSNPAVIAATSAALGVPTPAPCVPATASPWTPGSTTVMIGNIPALGQTSKCMCTWGGVIQVVSPGQFTVNVA